MSEVLEGYVSRSTGATRLLASQSSYDRRKVLHSQSDTAILPGRDGCIGTRCLREDGRSRIDSVIWPINRGVDVVSCLKDSRRDIDVWEDELSRGELDLAEFAVGSRDRGCSKLSSRD